MKVSKRSLIVSIAVLCVCALSLTAASFAWFSSSTTAKVDNIQLSVEKASDLQISIDGGRTWGYSFSSDFNEEINDYSTADAATFIVPADREKVGFDGKNNGDYKVSDVKPTTMTVYFRSMQPQVVQMSGNALAEGESIAPAVRAAAITTGTGKAGTYFFANAAATDNVCSTATAMKDITLNAISTKTTVVTLVEGGNYGQNKVEDGYYYGKAVITYYVEGTDEAAINDYTGVDFVHSWTFNVEK